MQLLKKITTKEVLGDVKLLARTHLRDVDLPVMQVFGFATKSEEKETELGSSFAHKGDFTAVNLITGETFMGNKLYIPEPMSGMLANITNSLIESEGKANVQTAFEIIMKPDAKSATGYVWRLKPLMEVKSSTPAAAMLEHFKSTGTVTVPAAEVAKEAEPVLIALLKKEPTAPAPEPMSTVQTGEPATEDTTKPSQGAKPGKK
jgi:hypothetical protein